MANLVQRIAQQVENHRSATSELNSSIIEVLEKLEKNYAGRNIESQRFVDVQSSYLAVKIPYRRIEDNGIISDRNVVRTVGQVARGMASGYGLKASLEEPKLWAGGIYMVEVRFTP